MTNIKLLGMGCSKTRITEANIKLAADQLRIAIQIEKVEDVDELLKYDITSTPAVVFDNQIKIRGRVAEVEELKKLFLQTAGNK